MPENKPRLEKLRDAFAKVDPFNAANVEAALKTTANELGVKVGVLVHPVRLATTGNPSGPSLYHLREGFGREKALTRGSRKAPIEASDFAGLGVKVSSSGRYGTKPIRRLACNPTLARRKM